tara:strand:- start:195 stop:590 length:396 start_codon:yes stop_codon:yes gene_type:complete
MVFTISLLDNTNTRITTREYKMSTTTPDYTPAVCFDLMESIGREVQLLRKIKTYKNNFQKVLDSIKVPNLDNVMADFQEHCDLHHPDDAPYCDILDQYVHSHALWIIDYMGGGLGATWTDSSDIHALLGQY